MKACDEEYLVSTLDDNNQPTDVAQLYRLDTAKPTIAPTTPTKFPTLSPSVSPSKSPTRAPSLSPTSEPSSSPTTEKEFLCNNGIRDNGEDFIDCGGICSIFSKCTEGQPCNLTASTPHKGCAPEFLCIDDVCSETIAPTQAPTTPMTLPVEWTELELKPLNELSLEYDPEMPRSDPPYDLKVETPTNAVTSITTFNVSMAHDFVSHLWLQNDEDDSQPTYFSGFMFVTPDVTKLRSNETCALLNKNAESPDYMSDRGHAIDLVKFMQTSANDQSGTFGLSLNSCGTKKEVQKISDTSQALSQYATVYYFALHVVQCLERSSFTEDWTSHSSTRYNLWNEDDYDDQTSILGADALFTDVQDTFVKYMQSRDERVSTEQIYTYLKNVLMEPNVDGVNSTVLPSVCNVDSRSVQIQYLHPFVLSGEASYDLDFLHVSNGNSNTDADSPITPLYVVTSGENSRTVRSDDLTMQMCYHSPRTQGSYPAHTDEHCRERNLYSLHKFYLYTHTPFRFKFEFARLPQIQKESFVFNVRTVYLSLYASVDESSNSEFELAMESVQFKPTGQLTFQVFGDRLLGSDHDECSVYERCHLRIHMEIEINPSTSRRQLVSWTSRSLRVHPVVRTAAQGSASFLETESFIPITTPMWNVERLHVAAPNRVFSVQNEIRSCMSSRNVLTHCVGGGVNECSDIYFVGATNTEYDMYVVANAANENAVQEALYECFPQTIIKHHDDTSYSPMDIAAIIVIIIFILIFTGAWVVWFWKLG
jgi:hypothetical protein